MPEVILFKLSAEEKKRLQILATSAHTSVSGYLRQLINARWADYEKKFEQLFEQIKWNPDNPNLTSAEILDMIKTAAADPFASDLAQQEDKK